MCDSDMTDELIHERERSKKIKAEMDAAIHDISNI